MSGVSAQAGKTREEGRGHLDSKKLNFRMMKSFSNVLKFSRMEVRDYRFYKSFFGASLEKDERREPRGG